MPEPMLHTKDIDVLRNQFEAWMDGAQAGARGEHTYDNPYLARSAKGDAWENGCERIRRSIKDACA